MKKTKKSNWKSKVAKNVETQVNAESSYGYLNLPKSIKIFKDQAGRMRFDIMPYIVSDPRHPDRDDELEIATPGELWYKRPFKVHRDIGASNDAVICPTSIGKKCPICEYRAERLKAGAEKDETDALRAKERNLYVVIPIGAKDYDEKPHIWDISHYLFQKELNTELEENEDNAVFPDLEDGRTLRVRFDEQKMGKNKFNETGRIDFEERDPYEEEILDEIPDLDKCLKILNYKELERLFLDLDEGDEAPEPEPEEEPEEERPRRRSRKTEEPEEEPEPEEERPARRARRKAVVEDDDPADEVEPNSGEPMTTRSRRKPEPEEEQPRPTRRKKPEPEEEPEPEKPTRRKSKREPVKDEGTPECPHGHTFADDCEKYDDCDVCEIWDACREAADQK